jgi:hypothetical protein
MVKALAVVAVIAACKSPPQIDPRDLDAGLDCTVKLVVQDNGDGQHLVSRILNDVRDTAPPALEKIALGRLDPALKDAEDLAALAFSYARAGDLKAAENVNLRAIDAVHKRARPRPDDLAAEALIAAWTGHAQFAEDLALEDTLSLLMAAEGAGRGGDRASAERIFEHAARTTPAFDSPPLHAQRAADLVWLGRTDEGIAIAAHEKPPWRAYALELMITAGQDAKSRDLDRLVAEAASVIAGLSPTPYVFDDESGLEDLLGFVSLLDQHGDHDAATALRARIGADAKPSDRVVLGILANAAEMAKRPQEADAFRARMDKVPAKDVLLMHLQRDELGKAFDDLARPDTDEFRPAALIGAWGKLSAHPELDAALGARFRAAACRPSAR